jgi:hypothetical protein
MLCPLEEDYYTLIHVLSEGSRPLTSGLLNVSLPGPRPLTSPARSPRLARLLRRSGRFVYYRRLVIVDHLARLARGFRDKYDLMIETRSSVPLKWANVSYVHFPVMTDLMTIHGKRTGFP